MAALSKREVEIWHAFKQMGQNVLSAVERDLLEATSLSGSDFAVLSRLVDLGSGELRQQALADSMNWHKSRLSHQLTRMEERGLVRRTEPEPRSIVVAITAAGRKKIDASRSVHASAVRAALLDRLSPTDLDHILAIAKKL